MRGATWLRPACSRHDAPGAGWLRRAPVRAPGRPLEPRTRLRRIACARELEWSCLRVLSKGRHRCYEGRGSRHPEHAPVEVLAARNGCLAMPPRNRRTISEMPRHIRTAGKAAGVPSNWRPAAKGAGSNMIASPPPPAARRKPLPAPHPCSRCQPGTLPVRRGLVAPARSGPSASRRRIPGYGLADSQA